MAKKLTEVLSIKEDDSKDKNKDGIDDDLQLLHDCDEKEPVKEELYKTIKKPPKGPCPQDYHQKFSHKGEAEDVCISDKYVKIEDAVKESTDLNECGTGRFNKRLKLAEQCGCGMDPMNDFDGISTANVVMPPPPSPDVFVAPPTDEEKNEIIWSFSGKVADMVEDLIETDPDLRKIYGHEIPRKSEIMHALLFDFVSQNLEKA
ncbi:MAG: hypothetical protein WC460_06770 [Patescibacteria group bacterium]